ncbi:oligosaccharide flippase family protein [Enterococcus raffinosus]|uniref:Oligosaccharide flippase family protein n=1 Tax=Enterococcus raffinosus TaxID=71452 RepID=A0AAW8T7Q0_9ENTE|nr:oligosaccharide flippase family protein [Enterococcus raffinosus]MDT2528643.1 oligosaccharide flippase family protein [Enterococcus raffinosus]MDT2542953.1 oligosaccharide flippase family protein [Enterococcus raffinosus]MDT2553352.1 oligosaccharide flippase family protein [Enterococcus raffinosus]QZO08117.1 oligosaccharide flippase family protein [Enterococcus raffinosus]
MSKSSSMMKKSLIYFAGNFSSKIFGVIIIPIYAQYLSAAQLGDYDFQQTVGNLLMPIIGLAIWEAILRFGLNAEGNELHEIITTAIFVLAATLSVSFMLLFIAYTNFYGFSTLTFLYVLLIMTMPIVTVFGYISRALGKSTLFAFSGVVSAGVNMLGLFILVVSMNKGLLGLLLSAILSNVFNILFLMIGTRIFSIVKRKYFSKKWAKKMIYFSAPLILNLVFGWFISSFSRFYIKLTIGSTENGIYAFASKFSGILLQLAGIINMSAIEDAVSSIGDNDWVKRFENNIENISSLFIQFSCLLIGVTGVYYNFVSNEDFKRSIILVPFLLLVAIFTNTSTLIGNIFPVFNKTGKAFTTTMIGGVTNILLSIVLGFFFGLIGIVVAQLVASITLVLSRYYYGQKIQKYSINIAKFLKLLIFFLAISFISISGNLLIQLITVLLTSVIVIILNRTWIITIVSRIKTRIDKRRGN